MPTVFEDFSPDVHVLLHDGCLYPHPRRGRIVCRVLPEDGSLQTGVALVLG